MEAGRVALLAAAVVALVVPGCAEQEPAPRERLRLAVPPQLFSAPVHLAARDGRYAAAGLDVELVETSTGRDALALVLDGAADVAVAAETPIVLALLEGAPVSIIATIADNDDAFRIVARRSRGVFRPEDLVGKRIAVWPGTNAEYFLAAFLAFHRLPRDSVEAVTVEGDEALDLLGSGAVAAAALWEPFAEEALDGLGTDAVTFPSAGIYLWTWNLAATRATIAERGAALERLLLALHRTSRDINHDRDGSRRRATELLGLPAERLAGLWTDTRFEVMLDQALLLNMEAQARWELARRGEPPVSPDLLDAIDTGPLRAAVPEAVTIIDPR